MPSINLNDLRANVTAAQEELKDVKNREAQLSAEVQKLTSRKTSLESFINCSQGILNAAPTGQDISAIGGVKILV